MPNFRNEQPVYSREQGFDMVICYDGSNRTEYVGIAAPGTPTSSALWSIYKLSYDLTSGGVAKRRYAEGSDEFNKIMDSYSTYSYTDI